MLTTTATLKLLERQSSTDWEKMERLAGHNNPRWDPFGEMSGLVGRVKNVAKVRPVFSPSRARQRSARGTRCKARLGPAE